MLLGSALSTPDLSTSTVHPLPCTFTEKEQQGQQ